MRNKIVAAGTVALLILIGFGVWMLAAERAAAPENTKTEQADSSQNSELSQLPETTDATTEKVTITYRNDGFEQSSYSVKKGVQVVIVNDSSQTLEFASDDHPTHLENKELNLDPIKPGGTLTFTPATAGSWGIHDHLNASKTTTLVVSE